MRIVETVKGIHIDMKGKGEINDINQGGKK